MAASTFGPCHKPNMRLKSITFNGMSIRRLVKFNFHPIFCNKSLKYHYTRSRSFQIRGRFRKYSLDIDLETCLNRLLKASLKHVYACDPMDVTKVRL